MFGEPVLRLLEDGAEPIPRLAPTSGIGARRWKMDPELAGQSFNGLGEIQPFQLHDELDGVTTRMTAKTVEEPLFRIDAERWRLLLVERAEALVLAAALFELDVIARDLDQIRGVPDLGDYLRVEIGVDHSGSILARP